MNKIGAIFALVACAVAGRHFEPGDEISGEGVNQDEKAKMLRQRQATEDKQEASKLRAARQALADAAAEAEAEEEDARQAEIEETIRPAVEKIVGEILNRRFPKAKAPSAPKSEGQTQG